MRRALAALTFAAVAVSASACAPRQVEVRTSAQPAAESTLRVTNNLAQAVNVYVVNGGNDIFLRQVAAHSAESVAVPGIPAGTTVGLKAVPVDGSRTYTRDNVQLVNLYEWQVP